jgi:uncharacterized protein (UPF0305 family)
MADKIEELDLNREIGKKELLHVLKREVSNIHVSEIMKADSFFRADAKYVPARYREELLKTSKKAFFSRIKNIKEDEKDYRESVDIKKLGEFLKTLKKQKKHAASSAELCFLKVAGLISIYATFILEEPIHAVGTPFPGRLKVRYRNGKYLCPVKDMQMENPNALCRFCISVQDRETL